MRTPLLAVTLVSALAAVSCSSATTAPVKTDSAPPTVSLPLAELSEVKGSFQVDVTAADDVGLAKIELFVGAADAAPIATATDSFDSLTWDSTSTDDGLATLFVRATDRSGKTADSAPVQVVVLNHGVQATDLAKVADTMAITTDLSGELDHKHHWNNPASIRMIVAVLDFKVPEGQTEWNLGLSVGTGECPDNGATVGPETVSTKSPMAVAARPTGAEQTTGLHFAHVRPINAADHKGQSLPHTVKVYLFQ